MPATARLPPALHPGDKVSIIAPSMSLSVITPEIRALAEARLLSLKLQVGYGRHAADVGPNNTASIDARLADLHEAFADRHTHAVLAAVGGAGANQLLPYIDYDLIARHPKPFVGFSDITVLNAAMLSCAGLVTYYGPTFYDLGMLLGAEYTLINLESALFQRGAFQLQFSSRWSDDAWRHDQHNRNFEDNPGARVIRPGRAIGRLVGGHLGTFSLLRGTPFMPDLAEAILILEEDDSAGENTEVLLERNLYALSQVPSFAQVQAMIFGRLPRRSGLSRRDLDRLLNSIPALSKMPIIADIDTGHTSPMTTWPYGALASLTAGEDGEIALAAIASAEESSSSCR